MVCNVGFIKEKLYFLTHEKEQFVENLLHAMSDSDTDRMKIKRCGAIEEKLRDNVNIHINELQ